MNKSGVWKSLEQKPSETKEESDGRKKGVCSGGQGIKDNTPDEGIVIKVTQLVYICQN